MTFRQYWWYKQIREGECWSVQTLKLLRRIRALIHQPNTWSLRAGTSEGREIWKKQLKIKFPMKGTISSNLLAQMLPSSSSWSILSPFSHVFNYDFYTSTSTGTTLTQDSFTSVVINHNSIQTVTTALHHLSQDSNELKRVWWWTGGPPRWYFQLKFPWFNLCFGSTGKNSMVVCCFSGWSMT